MLSGAGKVKSIDAYKIDLNNSQQGNLSHLYMNINKALEAHWATEYTQLQQSGKV